MSYSEIFSKYSQNLNIRKVLNALFVVTLRIFKKSLMSAKLNVNAVTRLRQIDPAGLTRAMTCK